MRRTMVEANQQMIESCARTKVHFDKIMTHLNQSVSTPISDQVQEFHQLSQVEFNSNQEDKQSTLEETLEDTM